MLMIDPHDCRGICLKAPGPCSICMTVTQHEDMWELRHPNLRNTAIICRSCATNPHVDAVERIQANWDRASV